MEVVFPKQYLYLLYYIVSLREHNPKENGEGHTMSTESSYLSRHRSPRRLGPDTSNSCGEEVSHRTSLSTHKLNTKTIHIFF